MPWNERQVRLPLAGEVMLSISRTRPGAARTMDLLEHAVRTSEDLMGRPFPVRYVALRFDEAVADSYTGINFGTHSAILPRYDTPGESGQPDAAGRIIAHEVAHYYWNRGEIWLDEGAAEFMGAYAHRAGDGRAPGAGQLPLRLGPRHRGAGSAGLHPRRPRLRLQLCPGRKAVPGPVPHFG